MSLLTTSFAYLLFDEINSPVLPSSVFSNGHNKHIHTSIQGDWLCVEASTASPKG